MAILYWKLKDYNNLYYQVIADNGWLSMLDYIKRNKYRILHYAFDPVADKLNVNKHYNIVLPKDIKFYKP